MTIYILQQLEDGNWENLWSRDDKNLLHKEMYYLRAKQETPHKYRIVEVRCDFSNHIVREV